MERQNPFIPLDARSLPPSGPKPLEVVLLRGTAVESRHRVHVHVCEASGEVVHQWGNPDLVFFPRSSIKILQTAAWVSLGNYKQWKIGAKELAIASASHEGEPYHVDLVASWLKQLGLGEEDLECGAHEPYHEPSAHELIRKSMRPNQLHNNCSGKHSGLLTACLGEGWPTAGYSNYDHPVQERLRQVLGEFFGMDLQRAPWGIDGCGIPTYAVPLRVLSLAMARTAEPKDLDSQIQSALALITKAIRERPEFIGGSSSFSTRVVTHTEGRVLAKEGAEGVYGAWTSDGLGIALKCEDGASRASEAALAAVLSELGYPLAFYSPLIPRWTGEIVGQFLCG